MGGNDSYQRCTLCNPRATVAHTSFVKGHDGGNSRQVELSLDAVPLPGQGEMPQVTNK